MAKTVQSWFGTMRPGVRISALRPKQKHSVWGAFVLLSVGCENSAFRLRKWSAPSDQAENSLLIWGAGSVTSNLLRSHLHTSTKKALKTLSFQGFFFVYCDAKTEGWFLVCFHKLFITLNLHNIKNENNPNHNIFIQIIKKYLWLYIWRHQSNLVLVLRSALHFYYGNIHFLNHLNTEFFAKLERLQFPLPLICH